MIKRPGCLLPFLPTAFFCLLPFLPTAFSAYCLFCLLPFLPSTFCFLETHVLNRRALLAMITRVTAVVHVRVKLNQ